MASGETDRITNCSVYPYDGELVVELTGVDEDGIIVVVSYEFDAPGDASVVEPKGTVDPDHVPHVRDGLADEGYEWQGRTKS
ncbi:hypothetical protein [Halosimplex salinum]|uniref:hypothetical protein n=1 Tax=Halosimplex salinum TaxID=1710538 RepID=UPI000F463FF5|nr:hypothetical protein [Halosimplex salinum]